MSRLTRSSGLAATALISSILLATPAHADDSYQVSFGTDGFASVNGAANTSQTVTVQNTTMTATTFVTSWGQIRTIPGRTSYGFVMPADAGVIVAQAIVIKPVHVIS